MKYFNFLYELSIDFQIFQIIKMSNHLFYNM